MVFLQLGGESGNESDLDQEDEEFLTRVSLCDVCTTGCYSGVTSFPILSVQCSSAVKYSCKH